MQQIRQHACDNEQHNRDLTWSYSGGLIIRQKEPANLEAPFDRTQVEVRDGVKPGDLVILNPPVELLNGTKVQPRSSNQLGSEQ